MRRKGDIFALQEFYLGLLLLILCILLFGLYWIAANHFKDKIDAPEQVEEDLAAAGAGSALRAYLAQGLDWPSDALSDTTLTAAAGTMAAGLEEALMDEGCRDWLATGKGAYTPLCEAVKERTEAFFSTLCSDYRFEARLGDATWTLGAGIDNRLSRAGRDERINYALVHGMIDEFSGPLTPEMLDDPHAHIRKGTQAVPTAAGALETRLVCIDREGSS